MAANTTATSTVTMHRVFCAPSDRVYRAFLDPDAIAEWLPPYGFTGRVLEMNTHVCGRYRMQFTNMDSGHSYAFGGEYLELVQGERIVHTDRFDDPKLPGELRTTVTFKAVAMGTEMTVVQEGPPSVIPVEACYVGWQQLLQLLGFLIEAEIPG